MFGMLVTLAEYQREMIVANTRDGLAARGGPPTRRPYRRVGCSCPAQRRGHITAEGGSRQGRLSRP